MPELPCGFDRADGEGGRPGTPAQDGQVLGQYAGVAEGSDPADNPIEEAEDSPVVERAEQATLTHTFKMGWNTALTHISTIGRGTIREDSFGNIFLVLSASIHRCPGRQAIMTVVEESKSFDVPPDEFSIVPVELGVNLLKHPRYFYAFFGDGYGSTTEQQNQMVIRLLQDYFDNTSAAFRDAILKLLADSIGDNDGAGSVQPPAYVGGAYDPAAKVAGTDMAKRAAMEIVQKYWRGEDTPYVVGYEMTWSQYFFVSPWLNPGGYVEDPIYDAVPQLPEFFFSRVYPPDPSQTIFDFIPAINPQCYSDDGTADGAVNISWLRKADQVEFQRTWFKLTSTWIGSPVGHWDTDLYTNEPRPSLPGDYRLLNA